MTEGHSYTVTTGNDRFQNREVLRFVDPQVQNKDLKAKRVFVPFAGFDGQALAGTGALVFEGELLSSAV